MKKVFIVIVHFGNPDETNICIESICKQKLDFEKIIIVDNNQNYKISQKLKNRKEIEIIKNFQNIGFAKGVNKALEYALNKKADYVLLLNNDTQIASNFLKELVDFASLHKEAGIVSPAIRYKKQGKFIYDLGGKINKLFGRTTHVEVSKINSQKEREVDYASGCAMLIRSDVIRKIGLFDPSFFLYYEDVDFCLRVREKGFGVFVLPKVFIDHSLSKSVGKNSAVAFYHQTKSALLFGKKHFSDKIILNRIFIIFQSILILSKNYKQASFLKAFRYI